MDAGFEIKLIVHICIAGRYVEDYLVIRSNGYDCISRYGAKGHPERQLT